jgi:hypothetical protein
MMSWLWQVGILVVVGVLLRRILRMDAPRLRSYHGLTLLNRDQARIYDLLERDLQIEAAVLDVTLNDAMEERDAGNSEVAWQMVRLAASAWDRLAGTLVTLLSQMSRYLPLARVDPLVRRVHPERFRSKTMVYYMRLHQMLAQFVFRSRLKFQLNLGLLRRAVETLTAEFRHLHRATDRLGVRLPELWVRLDFHFHDFDLLTKETLLALRDFLPSLSENELKKFGVDLRGQMPRLAPFDETTENKQPPRSLLPLERDGSGLHVIRD